jgi:hypothetical protein
VSALSVRKEIYGTADPVIVKRATTNLGENVSSGRPERSIDVLSALGAGLNEEQPFLFRPSFPFLGRHLPSLDREIALVAHEDTC